MNFLLQLALPCFGTAPGLSHEQARFVPGINPCCPLTLQGQTQFVPWDKPGVEELQTKFMWFRETGKEKHININKFAGLARDWVGAKILFI